MSGGNAPEKAVVDPEVQETLIAVGDLDGQRFDQAEVFTKKGKSRRVTLAPGHRTSVYSEERGWAVRAGNRRASFFASGTGQVTPAGPWPEPDGLGLRLPKPHAAPRWVLPSDFESPLIGEREGVALLDGIARALAEELTGSRLIQAAVEDGASEAQLMNCHGLKCRFRHRLASLHLEAVAPGAAGIRASLYLAERDARKFNPLALARRLADRLSILSQGRARPRDRGDCLLAPPLMARLLAGLTPLWVGTEAKLKVDRLWGGDRRIAGEGWTLLDNGRLPGGALEAPFDGEGVATRETVLVDSGEYRRPLLTWWQTRDSEYRESGCSRRASWRDLPSPGPTHLYLRPKAGISVADLLGDIARGYYLLEATGAGRFDWQENRFEIPVCGLEVRRGRATGPVNHCVLRGKITGFLASIQAVARDLAFLPLGGMIGSPTVLATGLELFAEEGPG